MPDVVTVVNMTPNASSGETNQDSEPNLAVNPANPLEMAGTAFTPSPNAGSKNSPIYYSNDGGSTWSLKDIIAGTPVRDQTLRFAATGGNLYAGVLWGGGGNIAAINFDILRTNDFTGLTTMTQLATRTNDDQPFVQASTVPSGPDVGKDRVYVGSNDHAPANIPATMDFSLDAAVAVPTTSTVVIESRSVNRDGFQTRPAVHPDGTVYALYYADLDGTNFDVVIVRDDDWAAGATPFNALIDTGDGKQGVRIATGVSNPFLSLFLGQQRIGGDLSIAVHPDDSAVVYVCWGDQAGGTYTLYVRKSTDSGVTWSGNLHTVVNATNPALAFNSKGRLGLVYQQVTGLSPVQRWQTTVELTHNDFGSTTSYVLANTPATTPAKAFDPYLGDYLYLMAVGTSFYGIFSANNTPDNANFPNGVTFQRNANFSTNTLLATDNVTPVAVSIDPFFFKVAPETGRVVTAIADSGTFPDTCVGSFSDEQLTIDNGGDGPLRISNIVSSSPEFLAPDVVSYPIELGKGDAIEVPIRFRPISAGAKSATITIFSDDPAGPHVVAVSGVVPAPKADLMIANSGDFGEVRLGRFVDRDLVINNRGPCPLSVTGIVSSAPVVFVIPSVVSFPLAVEGGDSIAVPIRFQPTNRGSATATLTIVSNDPNSPAVVNVSGTAWPPLPIAGTALTGFPLNDNSQHVFFIGTDKYVHELDIAVGGIWADNDLTTLAGAVPPTPTSALTGFRLGPALGPNTKHVFFIGTDNHVYELYFTAGTGWVFNDLTSLARAVPPTPTSALAGHSLSDDSKHVFFIGTDNHVHELFIAGGGRWADNDLTTLAGVGAKPPTPTSALTSYRLGDDSQHVFFIGTDNHVHELFIAGAGWHDNDLTALAGAVAPAAASALTGYRLVGDDSLHVFFIGTDNHVHELFFAGGSWAANNLTALAGAVPPTPTSALTGYPLSDNSQHVFFIGTDSHVHELSINGGSWADNDLTTLAGAVAPTPASALTGYPLGDNSKHVFFIGTDDHVHELYFTGGAGWVDNDLTALT
jgi:hypothetical protein